MSKPEQFMSIYFDHAAAMPPDGEILAFYLEAMKKYYANQEAGHRLGYELRRVLDEAAAGLSKAFTGSDEWQVVWGGSGTEIFEIFSASPVVSGRQVISSGLEHPALLAALRRHASGLTLLQPGRDGLLVPDAATGEVAAFHQVQSELGVIQDLEGLFSAFPGALRFVDAIQAAGRLRVFTGADVVAVSGVKFGAPGGAALLINPRWEAAGQLLAAAHDRRSREYLSGRVSPALALTLAFAAAKRAAALDEAAERAAAVSRFLRERCIALGLQPTIAPENASPYILHLMLPGYQAQVVVRMLSELGFMVAAGSACAAESKEPSPALRALGFSRGEAYGGLRLSIGFETTIADAEKLSVALETALKNY